MNNSRDNKLLNLYKFLRSCKNYAFLNDAMKYVHSNTHVHFFDDSMLSDIVSIIVKSNMNFNGAISDAEKLYNIIVFDKDNEKQRLTFLKLFVLYENNMTTYIDLEMFGHIYTIFENDKYAIDLFNTLSPDSQISKSHLSKVYSYVMDARQYYVDETAFYSSVLQVIRKIKEAEYALITDNYVQKVINDALEKDKKMAGLYDIDESKIESSVNTMTQLDEKQSKLEQKIADCTKIINDLYEDLEKKRKENRAVNENELEKLKKVYSDIQAMISELRKNINDNPVKNEEVTSSKLDILIQELTKYNKTQNSNMQSCSPADNSQSNSQVVVSEPKQPHKLDKSHFLYELFVDDLIAQIRKSIQKELNKKNNFDSEKKEKEFREKIDEIVDNDNIANDNTRSTIKDLNIPSKTFKFLKAYYWALYNDNLRLLSLLIKAIPVGKLSLKILDKNVTDLFNADEYLDLAINHSWLLLTFINNKKVELLKELLDVNPNYDLTFYDSEFRSGPSLDKLIEAIIIFGVEVIAANHEKLDKMLEKFSTEYYLIIKQIFDINQSFELYMDHQAFIIVVKFFNASEIAFLTEHEQKRLERLMINYDNKISDIKEKFNNIFDKHKADVKKLIASNSDVYIDCLILEMIDTSIISMDEYLNLDVKKSSKIITIYKDLRYATKQNVGKILVRKVKKQVSKII